MPRGRKRKADDDHSLLSMALVGYEQTKAKIETQITAIRNALGAAARSYTNIGATDAEAPSRKRRKRSRMSAEARKRIGDATRARWAAARKATQLTAKRTKRRLKLSAEERAKISGGQAKINGKNEAPS
jgi:hypothetical protein